MESGGQEEKSCSCVLSGHEQKRSRTISELSTKVGSFGFLHSTPCNILEMSDPVRKYLNLGKTAQPMAEGMELISKSLHLYRKSMGCLAMGCRGSKLFS